MPARSIRSLTPDRKLLRGELERRRNRLLKDYPDLKIKSVVEVTENDFILLSKNRHNVDALGFVEMDSGVVEAAYTETVMPGLLKSAGVDFPGEPCKTVDDLRAKYEIYLTGPEGLITQEDEYSKIQRRLRKGIRRLHGVEMLMKIQDDCEGVGIDSLLDLPSYRSYSAGNGASDEEIGEIRLRYYGMVGRSVLSVLAAKGIVLAQHVSGLIKDAKGCEGIEPAEDPYYISRLIRDKFGNGCTTLRHLLDDSGLLNSVFSKI